MSFVEDYNKELYHYGVKGMKWGVRRKRAAETVLNGVRDLLDPNRTIKSDGPPKTRIPSGAKTDGPPKTKIPKNAKIDGSPNSVNKNYTAKQRKQDRAFYGKGGEKRVNKKLNEGHGLRGARHYEAERKAKKEKAARIAKKGAKKTAKILGNIGAAYISDQVFNDGMGTRAAKTAAKYAGRAAVTAFVKARGGYDIHWYDR